MKRNPGWLLRRLTAWIGTRIYDEETGELLGKALLIPWRGRLHLVGYTGSVPLRPVVKSTRSVTYWKLTLAFRTATRPDYHRQR